MTNYYNADEAKDCLDLWEINFRGNVCPPVQNDGVLFVRKCKSLGVVFVRVCKSMGYCLSACANRRGTICPRVQK